jgi:hypothetical protein
MYRKKWMEAIYAEVLTSLNSPKGRNCRWDLSVSGEEIAPTKLIGEGKSNGVNRP